MVSVVKQSDRRVVIRPAEIPSDNRVDRFCPPYRQIIRGLASQSPRVADLAVTFPGLAFALATGFGEDCDREHCRNAIERGRPLKEAAAAIGLPLWLKKLPPEAFTQPLSCLPCEPETARRIAGHMPVESWRAVPWFRRVLLAGDLAGAQFAAWMAWRTKQAPRMRDLNRFVLLSAWAWYSEQPGTFGNELLRQPFHATVSFRKAMEEAEHWRKRIDLAVALGDGVRDTWYGPSTVNGYEFVPLTGIESFLSESSAMDNCLDQYGLQVSLQTTRIFSIKKGGKSVADIEIGPHDDDGSILAIKQLRGPGNKRASAAIWQAAYCWLGQQEPRLGTCRPPTMTEARAAARRVWMPYLSAMAGRTHEPLLRAFLKSGEVMDPDGS